MNGDRMKVIAYFPSNGIAVYKSTKRFSDHKYAKKYACSVMKNKAKKKGYKVLRCEGFGSKGDAHGTIEVKLPFKKRMKEFVSGKIEDIE